MGIGNLNTSGFYNKYLNYREVFKGSSNAPTRTFDNALAAAQPNTQNTQASSFQNASSSPADTLKNLGTLKNTLTSSAARFGNAAFNVVSNKGGNLSEGERMVNSLAPYQQNIGAAAARYNIPNQILAGLIWQESRGNPNAVSHCGAQGLGQLMPETAKMLGVTNSFDPAQNIDGAGKYLRQMHDKFGSWELAIAAYNAGPGNVQKHGGIPPFKETMAYVPAVLRGAESYKIASSAADQNAPKGMLV